MAVPKQKISSSKGKMRRAHLALKKTTINENSVSGEFHRPHHISSDGYYNGRKVTEAKINN